MKNTIPFWLAVVITVLVPLPLGMFLGNWNIPLWVSFIVWAQYFVYGAAPAAFKKILIPFACGVLFATAGMFLGALGGMFMSPYLVLNIGFGLAIAVMVGIMPRVKLFQECSLAYFNGMAMMLGVSSPESTRLPVRCCLWRRHWLLAAGLS